MKFAKFKCVQSGNFVSVTVRVGETDCDVYKILINIDSKSVDIERPQPSIKIIDKAQEDDEQTDESEEERLYMARILARVSEGLAKMFP